MQLAIADLGSNSVRFSIYRVSGMRHAALLCRSKTVLQLGRDVFSTGLISGTAFRNTASAFAGFRRVALKHSVEKIIAVATSAVRDAENGPDLIDFIARRSGVQVRIIPGSVEAELLAQAVTRRESSLTGLNALVDIGGGSTEISICHDHRVLAAASFPLGAARLHRLLRENLNGSAEALRRHIRAETEPAIQAQQWPFVQAVFASSGTMKAVMQVARRKTRSQREFKARTVKRIAALLSGDAGGKVVLPRKIAPWRVESLPAAAILLDEIMVLLAAKKIVLTKASLTEGVLAQELLRCELEKFRRPHTAQQAPKTVLPLLCRA